MSSRAGPRGATVTVFASVKWNANVPFGRAANALCFAALSIGAVGALSTPASLAQSGPTRGRKDVAHRRAEQRGFPVAVIRPHGPSTARDVDARSAASVELFGEALDSIRHPGTIDDLHYALLRKKYEKIKSTS